MNLNWGGKRCIFSIEGFFFSEWRDFLGNWLGTLDNSPLCTICEEQ